MIAAVRAVLHDAARTTPPGWRAGAADDRRVVGDLPKSRGGGHRRNGTVRTGPLLFPEHPEEVLSGRLFADLQSANHSPGAPVHTPRLGSFAAFGPTSLTFPVV